MHPATVAIVQAKPGRGGDDRLTFSLISCQIIRVIYVHENQLVSMCQNEFQSLGRRHHPIDTCVIVIFPVFPRVFDENTQPEHEDVRACETG